jgi:hypothetical protein
MPEVGSIIMGVIVSILILFLACCLLVIGMDRIQEMARAQEGQEVSQ